MTDPEYDDAEHASKTRDAYDRLAPVWSATTDDGPFNGGLERPAMRNLIPRPLPGSTVLDVGCGSGAQCVWLLDQGADVIGVDLSPRMVEAAAKRCGGRGGSSRPIWPSHYLSRPVRSTASRAPWCCTTCATGQRRWRRPRTRRRGDASGVRFRKTHGMPSHLNVEIKARCADPEAVLQRLQGLGAVLQGVDRQLDTYFHAATGRLKLRTGNIENSLIHYLREDHAGPKDSHVTLIETRAEESEALRSLLVGALGVVVEVDNLIWGVFVRLLTGSVQAQNAW